MFETNICKCRIFDIYELEPCTRLIKEIGLTVVSYCIKKDKQEPGGVELNPTEKHPNETFLSLFLHESKQAQKHVLSEP